MSHHHGAPPHGLDTAPSGAGPIPDSYWVHPSRLLAGRYPGSWDPDETRRRLRELLEAGVSCFLDLTEPHEGGGREYANHVPAVAAGAGRPAAHCRMPVPDFDVPSPGGMRAILDTLQARLRAGNTVYVHCWAGIGRTGTVIGCHLVEQGLTPEQALATIARLREGLPSAVWPSPEAPAQVDMVLGWRPRGRPGA